MIEGFSEDSNTKIESPLFIIENIVEKQPHQTSEPIVDNKEDDKSQYE